MDFQMSHNERLMEQIFRLYAVLRRGPGMGGEGEKGGRPSAQNRILLMLGESDGISQRDMTTLLRLRPQSVSETLGKEDGTDEEMYRAIETTSASSTSSSRTRAATG